MKKILVLVCFTSLCSLFPACTPDGEKTIRLRAEIEQKKLEIEEIKLELKELHQKVNTAWLQSLKYRFPDVQPITGGEIPVEMANLEYLKNVRFRYLSSHNKIQFTANYKTNQKDAKPQFYLYLFDDRGVNIHREEISYRKWGFRRSIPINKLVTQKESIEYISNSKAMHFLIREESVGS